MLSKFCCEAREMIIWSHSELPAQICSTPSCLTYHISQEEYRIQMEYFQSKHQFVPEIMTDIQSAQWEEVPSQNIQMDLKNNIHILEHCRTDLT